MNGVYPFSPDNLINPIAYFNEVTNKQVANKVMVNLGVTYKPIKDLSIKISGNATNTDSRYDNYTGVNYPNSTGNASLGTSNSLYLNSDNIITYNRTINADQAITATGAFTYENFTAKSLSASGSGFLSDATETYNIGSATTINVPSSSYSNWKMLSYLGRLNYSYKSKYLATVSFRADGSSRYSKGNKWGYFPSGALAWRISEEKFMLRERLKKLMFRVETMALVRANACKEELFSKNETELSLLGPDWRCVKDWNMQKGYRIPTWGEYRKIWSLIREAGESLLVSFMVNNPATETEKEKLLDDIVSYMNYSRISSCGIVFHIAAYWKAQEIKRSIRIN